MPDLIPFRGLRYASTSDLSRVAAPPYDVIDEAEREHLEGLDPHNAVRLILPRDHAGDDRYRIAAATLSEWQRDGTLRRDDQPTYTFVRMRFQDPAGQPRTAVGVIGALTLPDDADDTTILPHERTLPKAKSDRLALLEATRANLDPIWGLSLTHGLSTLLDVEGFPDAVCVDGDCVHEAWVVTDTTRIDAIRTAVGRSPVVLADGHHRFETAKRFQKTHGADTAGADAVMAFVVELADEQLCIEAIHRVARLPVDVDIRAAVAERFDVDDAGANQPDAVQPFLARAANERAIGLVDARGLALLRPRAEARRAAEVAWPSSVAATDAALVESALRPQLPDAEWDYRAGADAVAALVRTGVAEAALLLRPVTVAQTRAVAQSGARMPQKTTYFRPKPRTGFVFRSLG